MNVCSRACGYCGRCNGNPRPPEPERLKVCTRCGGDIIPGITGNISVAGKGVFCSRACADVTHEHGHITRRSA